MVSVFSWIIPYYHPRYWSLSGLSPIINHGISLSLVYPLLSLTVLVFPWFIPVITHGIGLSLVYPILSLTVLVFPCFFPHYHSLYWSFPVFSLIITHSIGLSLGYPLLSLTVLVFPWFVLLSLMVLVSSWFIPYYHSRYWSLPGLSLIITGRT